MKSSQLLATKYVIIGGNIDGINNEDEDTYNMSKKERRRREREAGEEAFKSGEYKKKKKKKKKFTINYDKLEEKVTRERPVLPREMKSEVKSNLGVPSRGNKKKTAVEKKLSVKAMRLQKQRTAGGTLDSSRETILPQEPEKQAVQIRIAKRSNKTITMVQGMTLPMKDRKVLLQEMKGKLGGGGALVDGVLEIQGSHADKVLDILKAKGYSQAKIVGGKK